MKVRDFAQLHVAHISSGTFQQSGGVTERGTAGKAEGHMIFPHHQIAQWTIPFENGDAPGIEKFARSGNDFANQGARSIGDRL